MSPPSLFPLVKGPWAGPAFSVAFLIQPFFSGKALCVLEIPFTFQNVLWLLPVLGEATGHLGAEV